jgi:hypothetical protein
MFGTLIKGTGLEKIEKTLISTSPQQQRSKKGMNMNGMACSLWALRPKLKLTILLIK